MFQSQPKNSPSSPGTPSVFFALLAWTLLNVAPLVVLPDTRGIVSWYVRGSKLSTDHLHAAYLVALFAMAFCGAFMLLICSVAKGLSGRYRALAGLVVVSFNALFVSFITMSWVWFSTKGLYLSLEDLSLIKYIPDLAPFGAYVSIGDISWAATPVASSFVGALALWLSVPAQHWKSATRTSCTYAGLCLLLAGGCLVWGWRISPSVREEFRFFLSYLTTPYGALTNDLVLGSIRTYQTVDDLPLSPSENLDTYMKRARSDGWDSSKPNVLVLVVEALRGDVVGLKEGGIEVMPTVNRLAGEGVVFQHSYANAPETGYSQSTLVTGLHPLKYPTRDFNRDLDYSFVTVFDLMHAAGYKTANLGLEWMVQRRITDNARIELRSRDFLGLQFHDTLSQVSHSERIQSLATIDRLQVEHLSRWIRDDSDQRPFFAFVYFNSSHFPYDQDPDYQGPFAPAHVDPQQVAFFGYPAELAPVMKNRYWNSLRRIDDMVKALTTSLAEAKKLDDTVIVITGDHGEMFHEHGEVTHAGRLHEAALRVPFVVAGPPARRYVVDSSNPVSHLDVVPTIVDAVGLPPFNGFQGQSVFKAAQPSSEKSTYPRPVFATAQTGVFEDAVISYPFKYVRGYRGEAPRLFRLDNDPGETRNVIDEERDITEKLDRLLDTFRNRQLSYYELSVSKRMSFFPPPVPSR